MIRAKFIKDIFKKTIKMVMVWKYIQMAIFILEDSRKIKSMGKANFIGLVFPRQ